MHAAGHLKFQKVRATVQDFWESTAPGRDQSAYEFLALCERNLYAKRPRFVAPIKHDKPFAVVRAAALFDQQAAQAFKELLTTPKARLA